MVGMMEKLQFLKYPQEIKMDNFIICNKYLHNNAYCESVTDLTYVVDTNSDLITL